jgi:conjugal transfer pilus assembly protein TraD
VSDAPARRRPPYWLVPVFVVLLISPPAWATAATIAAAIAGLAFRGLRERAERQADAMRARAAGPATSLGVDRRGHEVTLSDRELAAHGLIVGASGAGKSTTLLRILTDHVRRGHPVVALDLKGSPTFAGELAAAAAAAGRPFHLWTLDGPSVWNPLEHGNATELKDKLIATERFTEPHYQRAAERYVQIALQTLQAARPDRAVSLDDVVAAMEPHRLLGLARTLPSDRAHHLHDYVSSLTPDQLSAVRGLGTRMAIITESSAGAFLAPRRPSAGRSSIDLHAALERAGVVVFSLNSSTYGKLAAQIGTLVVQDLTSAAGRRLARTGPRPQAIIGVDEFSALGAENVLHLLARGREAGLPVLLATQEMADLDRAAPGLRDQVLGIVGLKIAHRQDVPSSAQTISQLAGTVTAWEETEQIGGRYFGGHRTGRGTRRQVERFRVHPNEVKTLRTGDAVLISKLPSTRVRTVRIAAPQRERDGPELS